MPDRYGDRDDGPAYRRGASTADDYDPTPTELAIFVAQARAALTIGCRYCHAQPGQPCRNDATGQPAHKFIAHPARIADIPDRVPPPTTHDEELF